MLSAAAVIMLGVAVMTRRANTGLDVIVSATPGQHRVNGLLRLEGEMPRRIAAVMSWAGGKVFAVNETIAIKRSTCSEEVVPSDASCKEAREGRSKDAKALVEAGLGTPYRGTYPMSWHPRHGHSFVLSHFTHPYFEGYYF